MVSPDHSPRGIFWSIWELGFAGALGVASGATESPDSGSRGICFLFLGEQTSGHKRKPHAPFLCNAAPTRAWPREGDLSPLCPVPPSPWRPGPQRPRSHSSFPSAVPTGADLAVCKQWKSLALQPHSATSLLEQSAKGLPKMKHYHRNSVGMAPLVFWWLFSKRPFNCTAHMAPWPGRVESTPICFSPRPLSVFSFSAASVLLFLRQHSFLLSAEGCTWQVGKRLRLRRAQLRWSVSGSGSRAPEPKLSPRIWNNCGGLYRSKHQAWDAVSPPWSFRLPRGRERRGRFRGR